MDRSIRLATPADAAEINAIYNPYVLGSTCTAEVDPVSVETRRAWFAARDLVRHPVTVATHGDEIVGWGALSPFKERFGYRFTVENSVYVRQDQHRRGVGRAILDDLVARATALGYTSIVALVTADIESSMSLHARAGFVERGRLPVVIHKLDRWLDLAILQRTLRV